MDTELSAGDSEKPHALFIIADDWNFVSHRLRFARYLIAHGFRVSIACRVELHREAIEEAGVSIYPIPFVRGRVSPLYVLSICWQLRKLIQLVKPSVVHPVTVRLVVMYWMATLVMGRPATVNAITGMGTLFSDRVSRWYLRLTKLFVQSLFLRVFRYPEAQNIWQNECDFQHFTENGMSPRGRSYLVRGVGVDCRGASYIQEPRNEKPVVVYVGRLLRDKGVLDLLEASRDLQKSGVEHELRVIGEPDPCNPSCLSEEQLSRWQQCRWIRFLGRREDVLQQMLSGNVVVLPSYREGLPLVLLEAGRAGRAVVTCDVPGCRDVVVDGENGLLVPPRDSKRLSDALRRLLSDPDWRETLGRANLDRIRKLFSEDVVFPKLLELFRGRSSNGDRE